MSKANCLLANRCMGPLVKRFEQVHVWSHGDSPPYGQTDYQISSTENITFPLSIAGGKNAIKIWFN